MLKTHHSIVPTTVNYCQEGRSTYTHANIYVMVRLRFRHLHNHYLSVHAFLNETTAEILRCDSIGLYCKINHMLVHCNTHVDVLQRSCRCVNHEERTTSFPQIFHCQSTIWIGEVMCSKQQYQSTN